MYHQQYLRKYGYQLTLQRMGAFERLFPKGIYLKDEFEFFIDNEQADDFRFFIQVRERMFIISERKENRYNYFRVVRVNEKASFKVNSEINGENHPWMNEVIPLGTILKGSSEPDYGTVNWLEGVGLHLNGCIIQVNREFIRYSVRC